MLTIRGDSALNLFFSAISGRKLPEQPVIYSGKEFKYIGFFHVKAGSFERTPLNIAFHHRKAKVKAVDIPDGTLEIGLVPYWLSEGKEKDIQTFVLLRDGTLGWEVTRDDIFKLQTTNE